MNILNEILAHKRLEVARSKAICNAEQLGLEAKSCSRMPLGFRDVLRTMTGPAVIAEIKRQSPSKGLICANFDASRIARAYAEGGAACISVLTDEKFFGGSLEILRQVRQAVELPILRKDFVVDTYQIDESRVAGADAILLIVAALSNAELLEFQNYARSLSLDVLVEIRTDEEYDRALSIGANMIGVNNRDLRTFEVDLATTERLAGRVDGSEIVLVTESGISNREDIARLERAGAAGFLVGESLMRQPDPGEALRALRRPL